MSDTNQENFSALFVKAAYTTPNRCRRSTLLLTLYKRFCLFSESRHRMSRMQRTHTIFSESCDLSKLSDMEWTIKDVMKGSETSKGVLGFSYEDKMSGTIELTMIKEEKIWKIDSLAMPKFDKFTLPQGNGNQADEK